MTDPIERPWDAKSHEVIEREAKIKRGNRRTVIFLGAAAGALVLVGLVAWIISPKNTAGPTQAVAEDDPISVWSACKQEMEGQLKSPSTAEFPSSLDLNFRHLGKKYTTVAYVDAQNGFGAMIRTAFGCVATDHGNGNFTAEVVVR